MSLTSHHLNIINATIRELLKQIDSLKEGRIKKDDVLRVIDDLENQVDSMLTDLAPERITDERFEAAINAVKDVTSKIRELRESIIFSRYSNAKKLILEVQASIRNCYRLLILIRAGAPTPLIFQVSPQFLRETLLQAPEALLYSNPMAAQIYNILVRKGEASIDELAFELKIDDKTRDEFNKAIAQLIATGYARPYLDSNNRMILKPAR